MGSNSATTDAARVDEIAPALLRGYPGLDSAKQRIIAHDEGPLLVIAGPGSGKTFSLVLRTLNLLLLKRADPSELIVCTFTEKAAFELRDRISQAARTVGYTADLTELASGPSTRSATGSCASSVTGLRSGRATRRSTTLPSFCSFSTSSARSSGTKGRCIPRSGRRSGARSRGCATTSTRSRRN
jgi:hypothetical protein